MEPTNTNTNIALVDNTLPSQPLSDDEDISPHNSTGELSRNLSRRWTRPSVRGQMKKRKYAKWQPHKLGLEDTRQPLDAAGRRQSSATTDSLGGESSSRVNSNTLVEGERMDFVDHERNGSAQMNGNEVTSSDDDIDKALSELDILYENQRGWFFFGIPLYSHSSLLNLDPSAWVTQDRRDSPVNITNAQVPDPSWEWAWKTWYVDMSGDVDEQGWQYSYSFSSKAWHGNHPWFHSFVRRRRWVRLRVKRDLHRHRTRERSGFEMAHMLNEDYFTIHSSRKTKRPSSTIVGSRVPSAYLSSAPTKVEEPVPLEEIANIPTLMYALKNTTVDREKMDALKRFIDDGADELFYLDERIPEIMSMFIFQASRWQFLTHLVTVINELSHQISETEGRDAIEITRKHDNLTSVAETTRKHITGPEFFGDLERSSVTELLDLTPASKRGSLLAKHGEPGYQPVTRGGPIKGIPLAAEIGRDGHIFNYSS